MSSMFIPDPVPGRYAAGTLNQVDCAAAPSAAALLALLLSGRYVRLVQAVQANPLLLYLRRSRRLDGVGGRDLRWCG